MHRTNTWGYLVNGSFTGIVGDMVAGFIDLSVTPFRYKIERLDVIRYTVETWSVEPAYIFRHPKSSTLRNNFLKPFPDDVWWVILITAGIYWTLLLLSLKFELYYDDQNEPIPSSVPETGLMTLAALAQQGYSDDPRNFSGRIIFLSLFLWGLLLFQFYSASIVGSLLTAPPRWIKDLDILSLSNLEVGSENIPYNFDNFRTTKDPVLLRMWQRKLKPTKERPNGSFYPASEGLRRVKAGGFAFNADTALQYEKIQETFNEDEICELEELRNIKARKVSPGVPKRSPFTKMIKYGLRQIVQSGLTVRLRKIWHPQRPKCPDYYSSKPTPLGLKEFSPALFLLFIGVGFGIAILIIEAMGYYYQVGLWLFDPRLPFSTIKM